MPHPRLLQRLLDRLITHLNILDLAPKGAVVSQDHLWRQGNKELEHHRVCLDVFQGRPGIRLDALLLKCLLEDRLGQIFDGFASQDFFAHAADYDLIGRFAGPEAGQVKLAAELPCLGLHGILHASFVDLNGHGQLPQIIFGGMNG